VNTCETVVRMKHLQADTTAYVHTPIANNDSLTPLQTTARRRPLEWLSWLQLKRSFTPQMSDISEHSNTSSMNLNENGTRMNGSTRLLNVLLTKTRSVSAAPTVQMKQNNNNNASIVDDQVECISSLYLYSFDNNR
jgi:hypothetical protein